jgi:hypothetical protein
MKITKFIRTPIIFVSVFLVSVMYSSNNNNVVIYFPPIVTNLLLLFITFLLTKLFTKIVFHVERVTKKYSYSINPSLLSDILDGFTVSFFGYVVSFISLVGWIVSGDPIVYRIYLSLIVSSSIVLFLSIQGLTLVIGFLLHIVGSEN